MKTELDLNQLQQLVLDCVRAGDERLLPHLSTRGSVDQQVRLGIYGNAYRQRLIETIETDHPVLGQYLGDELFEKMATSYIEAFPSDKPSLRNFCDSLATYLTQAEPFSDLPVIAELACFERALQNAFDAADANPITFDTLAGLKPEQWPHLLLSFHPSTAIFNTDWNCVEIWQALKQDVQPPERIAGSGHWLIWRNNERLTEFRSLEELELRVLSAALQAYDFSAMTELLAEAVEPEAVPQMIFGYLQQWISDGLVTAYRLKQATNGAH